MFLRDGDTVYRTWHTNGRGTEQLSHSFALIDILPWGRQEDWQDSPAGWPQQCSITRTNGGAPDWPPVSVWPGGRPIPQWSRLKAGYSDDLGTGRR